MQNEQRDFEILSGNPFNFEIYAMWQSSQEKCNVLLRILI